MPVDELQNLTDDDAVTFREQFCANKVSLAHKKAAASMNTIYEIFFDILSKRQGLEYPNVKVDQVQGKIALVDIPEGIYPEDYTEVKKIPAEEEGGEEKEETVEHKKNTEEMAVIVLKVPQVEEEEEIKLEGMDGEEEKTEIIKKIVDENQEGSAITIQGRDV